MNQEDKRRFVVLQSLYSTRDMPYVELIQRNNPYVLIDQFPSMLTADQARSALHFLCDKGLVRIEDTDQAMLKQNEKIFANQIQTKRFYRITGEGESFVESQNKVSSIFNESKGVGSQINVTNIGGVTVIGDKNIVNTKFSQAYSKLDEIKQSVLSNNHILDEDKLNFASDVQSLQSQLSKPNPNKDIARFAWEAIEKSTVAKAFGDLIKDIGESLGNLIG